MTVTTQIITQLDAREFLTGKWATTPAEVGFHYDASDLAGLTRNNLLEMARDVASEIDRRRAEAAGKHVYQIFDSLDRTASARAEHPRYLFDQLRRNNEQAEEEDNGLTYAIGQISPDGTITFDY